MPGENRSSNSPDSSACDETNRVEPLCVDVDRAGRLAVDQRLNRAVAAQHDVHVAAPGSGAGGARSGRQRSAAAPTRPLAVVRERVLGDRRGEVIRVVDCSGRARADVVRQALVAEVALRRQQARRRHIRQLPCVRTVVAEQPSDQRSPSVGTRPRRSGCGERAPVCRSGTRRASTRSRSCPRSCSRCPA